MSLFEELRELADNQSRMKDQYRLAADGSVLMHSITECGNIGFYQVAPRIPGAGPIIGKFFLTARDDSYRFMNVDSLRAAVALHGKIISHTVESRIMRRIENDLRRKL